MDDREIVARYLARDESAIRETAGKYGHRLRALARADHDAWEQVWASLPEGVKADLRNNNAYWKQFQDSTVQKASNTVSDNFLKSYGEELGLQTYGTVTDLLVVWYAETAKG